MIEFLAKTKAQNKLCIYKVMYYKNNQKYMTFIDNVSKVICTKEEITFITDIGKISFNQEILISYEKFAIYKTKTTKRNGKGRI